MKIYYLRCVEPFNCRIKYCRSKEKKSYLLVMEKDEFERLNLNKTAKKWLVDWCYKWNEYRLGICTKHYNELFKKHKDYISWCLI